MNCPLKIVLLLRNWAKVDDKTLSIVLGHIENTREIVLAQDLLSKCLVGDPLKRISIQEVRTHPWLNPDSPLKTSLKATMNIHRNKNEILDDQSTMGDRTSDGDGPQDEEESFDIRILAVKEVYVDGSYAVIVVVNPENKLRAENEAFQIRSTLLDHDFNILACVINEAATLSAIQEILDNVALTTTRKVKSRFVLYFSCRVLTKTSKQFFCLFGADIEKLRQTCMPMSSLFDFFLEIDCVHQLLISDCEFLDEHMHIDAICRPYENYETDTPSMHALINVGTKIDGDETDEKLSAFVGAILNALNGDLDDFKMKKQFVTLSNMYSEIQNRMRQSMRHASVQNFGLKIIHPIHKNKQAVSSQMIFYNPELREVPTQNDRDDNVDIIVQDSDEEAELVNDDLIQQLDDAAREIEIKNIFSRLDLNGDGKLSKKRMLEDNFWYNK